jgi:hypothetical protein
MIITEINGGLGNQLFQYAAGLALSSKHKTALKINVQFNTQDTKRKQALSNFQLDIQEAGPEEIEKYYPNSNLQRAIQKLLPAGWNKFYKEFGFAYQPSFQYLSSDVYLKGYWQSEQYFSSIASIIKESFVLHPSCYNKASACIQEIESSESVSLHVRKGDYLQSPYKDYYATLESDYYNKAIAFLQQFSPALKIFVFTDDTIWVKEHLRLHASFELVSGNQTNSMLEDFQAMQSCKYHVIANSSFSWWTAWLGSREGKQVIAPKNWFKNGPKDTEDLIPKTWHLL